MSQGDKRRYTGKQEHKASAKKTAATRKQKNAA
jgi:hypothetical protein